MNRNAPRNASLESFSESIDHETVELSRELMEFATEGLPSDQLLKATAWSEAPVESGEAEAGVANNIVLEVRKTLVPVDDAFHARVVANYGERSREFSTRLFARIAISNLLQRGRDAQVNWRSDRGSQTSSSNSESPSSTRKRIRDAMRVLDRMQAGRRELEEQHGLSAGLTEAYFAEFDRFYLRARALIEEPLYAIDLASSQQDVIDYAVLRTWCTRLTNGRPSTDDEKDRVRQLESKAQALKCHPMRRFNPAIDRVLREDVHGSAYRTLLAVTVDDRIRVLGASRINYIRDDVGPTYQRLFGARPRRSYNSTRSRAGGPFVRFASSIFRALGEDLNPRTVQAALDRGR